MIARMKIRWLRALRPHPMNSFAILNALPPVKTVYRASGQVHGMLLLFFSVVQGDGGDGEKDVVDGMTKLGEKVEVRLADF